MNDISSRVLVRRLSFKGENLKVGDSTLCPHCSDLMLMELSDWGQALSKGLGPAMWVGTIKSIDGKLTDPD